MNYMLIGEESERLMYRKIEETDFDTWLVFCKNPGSLDYIIPDATKSAEEKCKMWFDKVFGRYENNRGGMNALIEKQTGAFVGQCGLLVQHVDGIEELEVGYSLMPAFRGMGFAIEAARKCRDFAFENNFRDSLISIIHPDNVNSAKVARNNGMRLDKTTIFSGDPANIFRIRK